MFAEKISGAHADRPQLAKAIAALGEGLQARQAGAQHSRSLEHAGCNRQGCVSAGAKVTRVAG